jgi:hypothetical protein
MNKDAWIPLPPYRADRVWDDFVRDFAFKPSVYERDWPSFLEPAPSITWDISDLVDAFNPWLDPEAAPYNLALWKALRRCLPDDEPVLALDWQHASYDFHPHRFRKPEVTRNWCIPALPASEYHLFVTADHRLGSLGHPWAKTLCIFGEGLVEAYAALTPLEPGRIIRRQEGNQERRDRRQGKRPTGQSCPRRNIGRSGGGSRS